MNETYNIADETFHLRDENGGYMKHIYTQLLEAAVAASQVKVDAPDTWEILKEGDVHLQFEGGKELAFDRFISVRGIYFPCAHRIGAAFVFPGGTLLRNDFLGERTVQIYGLMEERNAANNWVPQHNVTRNEMMVSAGKILSEPRRMLKKNAQFDVNQWAKWFEGRVKTLLLTASAATRGGYSLVTEGDVASAKSNTSVIMQKATLALKGTDQISGLLELEKSVLKLMATR